MQGKKPSRIPKSAYKSKCNRTLTLVSNSSQIHPSLLSPQLPGFSFCFTNLSIPTSTVQILLAARPSLGHGPLHQELHLEKQPNSPSPQVINCPWLIIWGEGSQTSHCNIRIFYIYTNICKFIFLSSLNILCFLFLD